MFFRVGGRNSREDMVKTTFKDEVKFAQLRNRLVHSLIATVSLSPSWQVGSSCRIFISDLVCADKFHVP